MITIDTLVEIPRKLMTADEVEDVLARMRDYEKTHHCTAVALFTQNRPYGSICNIVSEEEARRALSKDVTAIMGEIPLKAYSIADYEARRTELSKREEPYLRSQT